MTTALFSEDNDNDDDNDDSDNNDFLGVLTVSAFHKQCQITAREQQRTHAHAQHANDDDDEKNAHSGGHPGTQDSKGQ